MHLKSAKLGIGSTAMKAFSELKNDLLMFTFCWFCFKLNTDYYTEHSNDIAYLVCLSLV